MTFPVGGLPDAGQLNDLMARQAPYKSVVFTHGVADMDLTDPVNKVGPAATQLTATSAGNLIARLAGDSGEQTYPVVAGTVVKGIFVLIKSTSTANCIAAQ